ncbi:MAG: hypothetical protein HRU77_04380 [Gammaproteobacteria bacterium]|nr:MAG: hypothetical protein HRU77_04380 [Gammaproteobacteria bacterium]
MSIFTEIERLINEHGSSTILKERILLLRDQHDILCKENAAKEKKILVLESQILNLKHEISDLQLINEKLKFENRQLQEKNKIFHNSNPHNDSCSNCGSNKLKRTGSRPHETFGDCGVIEIKYTCNDCGAESFVMFDPMQKGA